MNDSDLLRAMLKNPEPFGILMLGHARKWPAKKLLRELKKLKTAGQKA